MATGGMQLDISPAAGSQSKHEVYLLQAPEASLGYLRCLQSLGFHITAACCSFIGSVCSGIWKPGFRLPQHLSH